MGYPVSDGFLQALESSKRQIDVQVRIRNRLGDVRLGPSDLDLVDGNVTVEWNKNGPVRFSDVTLADPTGELFPLLSAGDGNPIWFSTKLDIKYGIRFSGSYEYCPVFRGWIDGLSPSAGSLTIHGVGKESRHLSPFVLRKSFQVDASTKWSRAIKDLLEERSIDDDLLDIPVLSSDEEAKRHSHYGLGMEPWLIMQAWADLLDKQLLFRQDGHVALRDWPTADDPAWTFVKGASSIILDPPEQTYSMDDIYNTVFVKTDRVIDDGPSAGTRPEPVEGFAELPDAHGLSSDTLSPGKPAIRIAEREGIRSFATANALADSILARSSSGLDAELNIRCLPLPHLEEMDVLKIGFAAEGVNVHSFRAKRFNIPLTPDGEMEINWQGSREPDHRHKKRFGSRKGRRPRVRTR